MTALPEWARNWRGRECSVGVRRPGTCSTCHWFDSHEVTGCAADGGECFHPLSPPVGIKGSHGREPGFYDFGHAPWCFLGRHMTCACYQKRTVPGVPVDEQRRQYAEMFGE